MTIGERLVVGRVRGLLGLRGHVRIEVLTDRPEERFGPGAILYLEGSPEALTVVEGSPVADGPGWRVRFAELADRSAVDHLREVFLEADVSDGPGEGAAWWHDVVGATVEDLDGRQLGTVRNVYRAGGAEVYAVEGGPAGPFDVPAVADFVRSFEPGQGRIVVDAASLDLVPTARAEHGDSARRRKTPS